ncbi:MAG: hypothetical protein J2P13_10130 [Acidobacteria bacterium]|nr:hypothetical protein [Acidobacteriota bacterium]
MFVCLGEPQLSPDQMMAKAAQEFVVTWFKNYFLGIHPTGIVISELEYRARTTIPFGKDTGLRVPQQPGLDALLQALQDDFRNWSKNFDYRKCDVLGLSGDGIQAELLEVTTGFNATSAITQLAQKLDILNRTVEKVHNLRLRAYPSGWRPNQAQKFREYSHNGEQITYICYEPTFRLQAPPGVILYEMHRLELKKVPVPVEAPQGAADRLRQAVLAGAHALEDLAAHAKAFLKANPDIANWIGALLAVCAVAVVIVAIIVLIAPAVAGVLAAMALAVALVGAASA